MMSNMKPEDACRGLKSKRRLQLSYSGRERVIEVHAVGFARDGRALMRAWQIRGESTGGENTGWKLFHLDEVTAAREIDENSRGSTQPGYRRDDPAITRMMCQI